MVAKFLDDNKPIKSFIQFHLIWQIFAKFSLGPCLLVLSLEKESDNFCVVFTYSIKRAREIKEVSCRSGETTAKKCTK